MWPGPEGQGQGPEKRCWPWPGSALGQCTLALMAGPTLTLDQQSHMLSDFEFGFSDDASLGMVYILLLSLLTKLFFIQ